jgi:autotransporter passenger strand-loop-strand repeat protein
MSGSSNAPGLTNFTSGDLVVSVVGDGDGSGSYMDNQATPIVLEELTTSGAEVGQETLPQAASTNGGTAEDPISGEYGSSSEGSLELSGDGKSLVIAGYGVNDTTYNQGEENGNNVYGNVALAQSTSLTNQTTYTPVPRVIADISYNNIIDTSTALYNVFNTNNPRSVATINGKTFYITGQGVKGDSTQGVFLAQDGASSATAIDTSSDTRTAEIYNGKLYVSRDSTQAGGGSIGAYGATLPTGATAPTTLPGIAATVTLTAAQENSVNSGAVGQSVELSPENYFFANPTTLYVADGGQPKEGGIGDGGLQKWTLNPATGVWTLQYTLSAGLNLIENSSADPADTAGTTGLIGLTGVVNANGTVTLYATNSTIGDLNQTYVYSITDTVSATIPAPNESFAVIDTAAADTNVRGIALAPAATGLNITIGANQTSPAGLIISTGDSLTVSAGGAAVAVVVNSGGTASIAGTDSNSLIQALGTETVTGQATGDQVWGTQSVTGAGASASNETVEYGGTIDVYAGATATSTTVQTSGGLYLSGGGTANNVIVNGGSIVLQTALDTLSGLVTFNGPGEVVRSAVGAAGTGITGAILNFGTSDVIDDTFMGTGAALTSSYSNGNTNVTLTSGTGQNTVSDEFSFIGKYAAGTFIETYVAGSGTEVIIKAVTVASNTTSTVQSGYTQPDITVSKGGTLNVLVGGTITSAAILSKGSASVAGTDSGTTIAAGGSETISGAGSEATGDQIYGTQTVKSGTVINETVYSGGSLILDGNATADLVISGGSAVISTSTDTIGGTVTFAGAGELLIDAAPASTADGLTAVVSGFAAGDVINAAFVGTNTALTSVTSGGNTVVTITGNAGSQSVTFAGTYAPGFFQLSGTEIFAGAPTTVISSGQSTTPNFVVSSGTVLDVLHGGTATNVTVAMGGSANFAGTDTGTTIASGGSATVSATGVQTSATVQQGGNEIVLGAATGNTIAAAGIVSIGVSGTDTNTDILAGGYEVMSGTATGDQVSGVQLVSAGTAVVNNETVFNGGMIDLYLKGAVANNTILDTGGSLNISGNATANDTVIQGGSLVLQSPKAVLADGVTFAGAGTIALTVLTTTSAGSYGDQAVISGFGAGDVIDVTSIGTGASLSSSTSGGNTVETITSTTTSGTVTESFIFAGTVAPPGLTLMSDGGTGVELVEPACFCAGTNIRTPDGDAPVETLKIGDIVLTASGQAVPVRWIGINTVSTRFADPLRVMPIRISAGALGENLPERDLLVSPDHAMFLGGILLQAGALVNGSSIAREARMPEIFTYYHVELADHELILAEGAATETFVDNVDRMAFDNWEEHERLYGSEADIVEMPYPRVRSARQLPMAMRRLLAARAAAICSTALAG